MHFKIVIALLLVLSGCKTLAQDTERVDLSSGPGMIVIKGLIKELPAGPTAFCGQSIPYLATVEVLEVVSYGAGVTHMPQQGTEVAVHFFMGYERVSLNEEIEVPGVEVGGQVAMQLRDKPCFGSSNAYYQVFNYQSL